jgi:dolichol-phosphate mannosyltransferase
MKIAVAIPVYKESRGILAVLSRIGPEVSLIVVVDDGCPESCADLVEQQCKDPRVKVLRHSKNLGVGAAMLTAYRYILEHTDHSIIVKLDGDGQMNPADIVKLVQPILDDQADYVKANRFYSREGLSQMPTYRLIGNTIFSFINKAASGYWNLMDPTNGFTAIDRALLANIPLHKISARYFFESDMLFRLYLLRAKVVEVPIAAFYADETSSIRNSDVLWHFPLGYLRSLFKRIAYCYFLHDFNVASLQLVFGSLFFLFGSLFGAINWTISILTGIPATTGTVMLAALPVILGFQMLLNVLTFDVLNVPKVRAKQLLR